jgi:hypothetical protein
VVARPGSRSVSESVNSSLRHPPGELEVTFPCILLDVHHMEKYFK